MKGSGVPDPAFHGAFSRVTGMIPLMLPLPATRLRI